MRNIFFIALVLLIASSCSKEIITTNNVNQKDLYDEFWSHVNENYIYFKEKEVDWNEVYKTYAPTVKANSTDEELLKAMEQSLLKLRDNHNIIKTPFRKSLVYNIREGYEVHYSSELVEEKYIDGALKSERSFKYGNIDEKTLYIQIPKMEYVTNLRNLIRTLVTDETMNLIIDVRNNGGGNSNSVPKLLGDFVKEKTFLGNYIEKFGPLHEDEISAPMYAEPSPDYHFDIKVFLLINRACYSATTYFAGMVNALPNFILVGQVTGGGGGGPAGFELSNGWAVSVTVSDFTDSAGRSIELGIEPHIAIENTESDIANGRDVMLEKALELGE